MAKEEVVRKSMLKGIVWYAIYVALFLWSTYELLHYEDSFDSHGGNPVGSFRTMDGFQIAASIIYRYVLNFPLSIFNWFTESFLWLTIFFVIPNAFLTRFLFKKLLCRWGNGSN